METALNAAAKDSDIHADHHDKFKKSHSSERKLTSNCPFSGFLSTHASNSWFGLCFILNSKWRILSAFGPCFKAQRVLQSQFHSFIHTMMAALLPFTTSRSNVGFNVLWELNLQSNHCSISSNSHPFLIQSIAQICIGNIYFHFID